MGQQQQQQSFNNGVIAGGGDIVDPIQRQQDSALVSKFIGMLDNSDTDVLFEMLSVIRTHLNIGVGHGQSGGTSTTCSAHVALVFASFKLARRIRCDEQECEDDDTTPSSTNEQPEIIPPVDADANADADDEDDNAKE